MRETPATESGRRMLDDWQARRTHPPTAARQEAYRAFILAIEAEARQQAEARVAAIREAVEALPLGRAYHDGRPCTPVPGEPCAVTGHWHMTLRRTAVLALLTDPATSTPSEPTP